MTQKELAEKLGASTSSVSEWVQGKSLPHGELLIKLIDLLDVVSDVFPKYKKATSGESIESQIFAKKDEIDQLKEMIKKLEAKIEDPTATKMNVKDVGIQPPDFK